ncbi:hypothetical protein CBR_g6332 [Chara braunii]|uniref:Uncharacterized protein n=1 Tax=Chara braunii TaxID=69332 RepID=A0A388KJH0_CHABU|nr:hypothetical protein CBR_g6332 [Chara braunii]|eukprot:GBG70200.1 hypothetical protein CBR_g6332 [Chara braunii]
MKREGNHEAAMIVHEKNEIGEEGETTGSGASGGGDQYASIATRLATTLTSEKEEAKQREEERRIREEEEQAIREVKVAKKRERRRREAEGRAELKKDLGLQLATQVHDMEDKFVQRMKWVVAELQKLPSGKGKEVQQFSDTEGSSSESEASITQELSERTAGLVISEKRKRGPDKVVGDSPPYGVSS